MLGMISHLCHFPPAGLSCHLASILSPLEMLWFLQHNMVSVLFCVVPLLWTACAHVVICVVACVCSTCVVVCVVACVVASVVA